jgi:hypothetical protein
MNKTVQTENPTAKDQKDPIKIINNKILIDPSIDVYAVTVFNRDKHLVKKALQSNELDVADLPFGVYFIRVKDCKGKLYTKSVIIYV